MLEKPEVAFPREREDHAATQGFFGGLVLGVLLGVVLALVFAPMRGEETRAAVAHKAMDVKDKAMHLVHMDPAEGADLADNPDRGAAMEREIGG
jgi:hypothetical protein